MAHCWYVIRTRPRCERLASESLQRDGHDVFFPRVKAQGQVSGDVIVPLFPGYLFLRCDPEARDWAAAGRASGVLGWVRFEDEVPVVPDDVIEELARRVREVNSDGGLWTRFRPGDAVHVESGKLDRLAWVLDEPGSPEARVRVLIEFMGRLVPAEVPRRGLRPVGQGELETHRRRGRRTRGRGRWIQGFGPRGLAAV